MLNNQLFYVDNLMYDTICPYQKCIGMHWGQIFNFQNTFDRACDEIRLEIQSRNCRRMSNLNEIKALID
jgi:hypothetical protein